MKLNPRRIALAVAAGTLALLGGQTFAPEPASRSLATEVTLWTAGATGPARSGIHAALPDAVTAPATAVPVSDPSALRRKFPALQHLILEGDGIDAWAADALAGLAVSWHRPSPPAVAPTAFTMVVVPHTLPVGRRLTVHGGVGHLSTDRPVVLTLEGPDGARVSTEVRATPGGSAPFSLTSATAAVAVGRFEWKLRLGTAGETVSLGVQAIEPDLPRVLLLQASPSVEGARLQRWLAETGTRVTSRTRVSAAHWRFTSAHGSPPEIPELTAAALAEFDVVVASEAAITDLPAASQAALDDAIRGLGLGLLIWGESGGDAAWFSTSWQVRPEPGAGSDAGPRLARLRLPEGGEIEEAIPVWPAEIAAEAATRAVVRDPQGRSLVVAAPRDSGWVARSLVADTWLWLQSGHRESFARYWSAVLSAVARPARASLRPWLVEPGTEPRFVHQPLRLSWLGASPGPLPAAEVRWVGEPRSLSVPLELTRGPSEPSIARGRFWPAQPGWHEVRTLPAGAPLAIFVQPPDALPGVRSRLRRDVTARLVVDAPPRATTPAIPPQPIHTGMPARTVLLAIFVAAVGWLWFTERASARHDSA